MEELKNNKALNELLLLHDNIVLEIEEKGMDKEMAQRLYDIYDAMSDILIENPDVVMEELYRNPSVMKYYSLGSLQRVYDNVNPEQQQWLLDNRHYWSGRDNGNE